MTTVAEDHTIEESGLLDGLAGPARAERAELVDWLLTKGVSVEQIRSAVSPTLLVSRRIFGDDGELVSVRDVAERADLALALTERLLRAIGLPHTDSPDERVYLRADGEAAVQIAEFVRLGVSPGELVRTVRTLSEGMAPVAELMRNAALNLVMSPGATELDVAQRSETLLESSLPLVGPMVTDLLMVKLRDVLRTRAVSAEERAQGVPPGAEDIAVGFADLVDFTRLGEMMPPEQIEQMALRLFDIARDVVDPPVRLVKTIGDAVMVVSPDPLLLLKAMLDLSDAARAEEGLPRLRTGLAWGPAVGRSGDWFGSPVNLASRVTGAARPDTVLVTEIFRQQVGDRDDIAWSYVGGRRLKGISGEAKLFRARRISSERR